MILGTENLYCWAKSDSKLSRKRARMNNQLENVSVDP